MEIISSSPSTLSKIIGVVFLYYLNVRNHSLV